MKESFFSIFSRISLGLLENSSGSPSPFLLNLVFLLYFSQTLSPLFKLYMPILTGNHDKLLSLFFYSNFTNLLIFNENALFLLIFQCLSIITIFLPFILICATILLQRHFGIKHSEKGLLWEFIRVFLELYDWVFVMPLLEMFVNPLDCEWYSFSRDCENNEIQAFLGIAVISVFWTVLQGVFLAFSCKTFEYKTGRIECKWSVYSFFRILIRNTSVVLFYLIEKFSFLLYFLLYGFGIIAFIEILVDDPFVDRNALKAYFRFLVVYESTLLLVTFWRYSSVLENDTLFYCLILIALLSFKFGNKLLDIFLKRTRFLFKKRFSLPALIEILHLQDRNLSNKEFLELLEFFTHHFRRSNCSEPVCQTLRLEFTENPAAFINKTKNIHKFKSSKILNFVLKKDTNSDKNVLILKYMDFLRKNELNPKKLLFLFERLKPRLRIDSAFLKVYIGRLDSVIKDRIFSKGYMQKVASSDSSEDILQLGGFFKMHKYSKKVVFEMKELLFLKKVFWGQYARGFIKTEDFIQKIGELASRIESFKSSVLRKSQKIDCRPLFCKIFAVIHSVFGNNIALALKFEEEFEKLFVNELLTKENNKMKLSFCDKSVVICEASFLNYEGVIRESSKSMKLAALFGFSGLEIQAVKKIEEFMPPFFANFHCEFMKMYINNNGRKKSSSMPILAFGQHKSGFIFPLRICYALQFIPNDFIIAAALKFDPNYEEKIIVFNIEGDVLGLSQKTIAMFSHNLSGFELQKFMKRNLFEFCYEIKEIIKNQLSNRDFIMGQSGFIEWNFSPSHADLNKSAQKSNKSMGFHMTFDLKLYRYTLSSETTLTVLKLMIVSFEIWNLKKTIMMRKIASSMLTPAETKDFNENIIDSFDSKDEIDKAPKLFEAKRKSELNACNENSLEPKLEEILGPVKKFRGHPALFDSEMLNPRIEVKDPKNQSLEKKKKSVSMNEEGAKLSDSAAISDRGDRVISDRVPSHQSSTVKSNAKIQNVYANIEKIKSFVPQNMYFLNLSVLIEIILILSYYLFLSTKVDNYLHESFYPMQSTIVRYCQVYQDAASTAAIMIEVEYQYLNLTAPDPKFNYNEIYLQMMNRSFEDMRLNLEKERTKTHSKDYEAIYYYSSALNVDLASKPLRLLAMANIDLLEQILNYVQELIIKVKNFSQINYDFMIYLPRMFMFFMLPGANGFTAVQNTWTADTLALNDLFGSVFFMFICFSFILKLFQCFEIWSLYKVINKLATIFLRCSQAEALKEIILVDEFLHSYEHGAGILELNPAEKFLTRKTNGGGFYHEKKLSINNNIQKQTKNFKNEKNRKQLVVKSHHSYSKINQLKPTKALFFVLLSFLLSFGYFYGNYYSWIMFKQQIQEVIAFDVSFVSAYVFSITVYNCNNLYLREILIRNPDYEALKNVYQTSEGRRTFLVSALKKRIPFITNIFNNEIEKHVMKARDTVNLANFQKLSEGNICEVLWESGRIEANEVEICEGLWNGAFNKGIMIAASQYLREVNEFTPWIYGVSNSSEMKANVSKYIKDPSHQKFFLGSKYLTDALRLFYDSINDFYNPLLEEQHSGFERTLILSMLLLGLLLVLGVAFVGKFWRSYYHFLSLSLSLIPYPKITEEEALIQIIARFTKN